MMLLYAFRHASEKVLFERFRNELIAAPFAPAAAAFFCKTLSFLVSQCLTVPQVSRGLRFAVARRLHRRGRTLSAL